MCCEASNEGTTDRASRRYAMRFYLETVGKGKPLEPTDTNLDAVLKPISPPRSPSLFDHIRHVLDDEYEVRISPATIVFQAAEDYAAEMEGRRHDDATIHKGDEIRAAVAQLRTPAEVDVALARQQRDWLLSLRADTPAELGRLVKAGTHHYDGLVNLLDALLDSVEGYSLPLEWNIEVDRRIYIVERDTSDTDKLYAFEDEDRAREFASRYPKAILHEDVLMNHSAAGQFLIDTADEATNPDEGSQADPK